MLMGNFLRPVTVLALQIASGGGGGSGGKEGSGGGGDSRSSGSGGGGDEVSGVDGGGSGTGRSGRRGAEGRGGGSSPPAWLSSRRRVLLDEWRVVELVGGVLEQLVPSLGPNSHASVAYNNAADLEKVGTMHMLMGAVCAVALAFLDRVWAAAGALGAQTQAKERQAKAKQRSGGGGSSIGSGKGGGKRAALAAARSPPVWVWPTSRVVQLRDAVRALLGTGSARYMEPELDALTKLLDVVKAGGPELPYKYDTPFVWAALKLRTNSPLVGGFQWLCGGEVPTPEALDGMLRTCSYPACVSLEGDSEAGAEGWLAACGRGCGGAWYCSQACAEAHWREGHWETCVGGAAAEGLRKAAGSSFRG